MTDPSRSMLSKIAHLAPILLSRPGEALDRVATFAEVRLDALGHEPDYRAVESDEALAKVSEALGLELAPFAEEPALAEIEQAVRGGAAALDRGPFTADHNADFALARTAYMICRALKPRIMVETGVAYGVTTSFVLRAMAENEIGTLHSIDLPPLGPDADDSVGRLIPEGLKARWALHRGQTRRVLPGLVQRVAPLDIFMHDSLHTRRTMLWEFRTALAKLARPGVILSDDIDFNAAFADLEAETAPRYAAAVRKPDRGGLFGVAVYRD